MPFRQFFLYNLAGSALWASVIVTLAFFIGQIVSLEQLVGWIAQFRRCKHDLWRCFWIVSVPVSLINQKLAVR